MTATPAIVEKGEEEEHPLQTGWSLWYVMRNECRKLVDIGDK